MTTQVSNVRHEHARARCRGRVAAVGRFARARRSKPRRLSPSRRIAQRLVSLTSSACSHTFVMTASLGSSVDVRHALESCAGMGEGTTTRCSGLRCVWALGRGFLSCACILLRRTDIRASDPAYSGFDGYMSHARLAVSSVVKATSSLTHSVSVSLGGQNNHTITSEYITRATSSSEYIPRIHSPCALGRAHGSHSLSTLS